MNRNFIFVLILLATLSMVNAIPHQLYKRTTTFGPCANVPPRTTSIDVTLTPDPVVAGQTDTFTISGKFGEEVNTATKVVVAFAAPKIIEPIFLDNVCKYTTCPIPGGTEMVAKVPIPVPASLPSTNNGIGVAIANSPEDPLGCAVAIVGKLPPDALDFEFY